jgi:hypothetical protein
MVFDEGVTVYLAAKVLGLNYSTAKAIAKKFRRNKNILKSKEKSTKSVGTQTDDRAQLVETKTQTTENPERTQTQGSTSTLASETVG